MAAIYSVNKRSLSSPPADRRPFRSFLLWLLDYDYNNEYVFLFTFSSDRGTVSSLGFQILTTQVVRSQFWTLLVGGWCGQATL